MAERRMIAKTIVTSDAFLDMPATSRSLYMLFVVLADDDGFVNAPRSIMRMSGATDDDLRLLIAKRFILTFASGVVVIKHWKIHNLIQKDRYKETKYLDEKATLALDENNAYTEANNAMCTEWIQPVSNLEPQVRLGKERLGKDRENNEPQKRFTKPTIEDVQAYCQERNNNVDAQKWYDYYSANGWRVGKNPMKDWKAAIRTWERGDSSGKPKRKPIDFEPYPDEY